MTSPYFKKIQYINNTDLKVFSCEKKRDPEEGSNNNFFVKDIDTKVSINPETHTYVLEFDGKTYASDTSVTSVIKGETKFISKKMQAAADIGTVAHKVMYDTSINDAKWYFLYDEGEKVEYNAEESYIKSESLPFLVKMETNIREFLKPFYMATTHETRHKKNVVGLALEEKLIFQVEVNGQTLNIGGCADVVVAKFNDNKEVELYIIDHKTSTCASTIPQDWRIQVAVYLDLWKHIIEANGYTVTRGECYVNCLGYDHLRLAHTYDVNDTIPHDTLITVFASRLESLHPVEVSPEKINVDAIFARMQNVSLMSTEIAQIKKSLNDLEKKKQALIDETKELLFSINTSSFRIPGAFDVKNTTSARVSIDSEKVHLFHPELLKYSMTTGDLCVTINDEIKMML